MHPLFHKVCALAACAALSSACRGRSHDQEEGAYLLTADTLIRDDCSRLSGGSPVLSGELVVAGNTVQMRNGPYGMQLVGAYRSNEEQFFVDGSAANLTETINAAECLLDEVMFHVDAITDTPETFHGTARIRYLARTDACSCEVWTTFRAVKQ